MGMEGPERVVCCTLCLCMAVAVFSSVALVYLTALVYMPAKREINSGLSDMGGKSKIQLFPAHIAQLQGGPFGTYLGWVDFICCSTILSPCQAKVGRRWNS